MSIVHIAFYPSDWLAGTRGLSDAEAGVYINLICRMYEMAGPIERDDNRLARVCGCKSKASFVKSLNYLIAEGKIIQSGQELFNERVQKEIKNTTEKSSKAKSAAQSRWDKKSNKNNDSANANASSEHMPDECQSEPESEPYINSSFQSELSAPTKPDNSKIEINQAFEAYNLAAQENDWAVCQKISKARTSQMKARLKDCGGIDGFMACLEKCKASDFLQGRVGGSNGAFQLGIDFILRDSSFTKIMEGNYDNRKQPEKQKSMSSASMFFEAARQAEGLTQ
jgi:uncharacterized protein YdaU (DUF1376 family)